MYLVADGLANSIMIYIKGALCVMALISMLLFELQRHT